ncbi:hypothetical protein EPO44_16220 [bacterium]|nr:MAG: hypothetical protein EPO44_16220 [bacterium]
MGDERDSFVTLGADRVTCGPGKLPQIGSGLDKAVRDFTKAIRGEDPKEGSKKDKALEKRVPRNTHIKE